MKMSRYGLLGMALVISTFVLVLMAVAPKPGAQDASRRLAVLGRAIDLHAVRHDGRMPPTIDALAEEDLLPADFAASISKQVKYVAAGRSRDALSAYGIVAVEDPTDVAGSILVAVLLSDGTVMSIPADVVRDAANRPESLSRVTSGPDGQLRVVTAATE